MRVAHFAIQFSLGHECRHRVHHEHIDGVRTHQGFDDLEGLLAVIRLADQQIIDVHSEFACVGRVQSVLRIHKCGQSAGLLRLRNYLQGNRRLTRGLRPEDLNHPAPGNSTYAQRCVKRD
jgi:hypothetical protein